MRKVIISTSIFLLLSTSSFALKNEETCNVYGSAGKLVSDFMLPLTVQELINMLTGKDNDLLKELTQTMTSGLSADELAAFASLGAEDSEVLGELAGQTAIQLLMQGQATSSNEVKAIMVNQCNQIGTANLISRMKQAKQALQGNSALKEFWKTRYFKRATITICSPFTVFIRQIVLINRLCFLSL